MINDSFQDDKADVYDARCPTSEDVLTRSGVFIVSFILACTISVVLTFGALLGNALILLVLHRASSIHPPSRALFYSLAASDLCVGLLVQPAFAVYCVSTVRGIAAVCTSVLPYFDVIGFAFCGISLLTTTAIGLDRLLALRLKLRYRDAVSLGRTRLVVVLTWLVSFAVGSTQLFSPASFTIAQIVGVFSCVAGSSFSYTRIHWILRHRQKRRQAGKPAWQLPSAGSVSGFSNHSISRYKKTVSTALWVYSFLVVCYMPYMVVAAVWVVFGATDTIVIAHSYAIVLVYLNSSLNPVLYCWKIREVRYAVKEIVRDIFTSRTNCHH